MERRFLGSRVSASPLHLKSRIINQYLTHERNKHWRYDDLLKFRKEAGNDKENCKFFAAVASGFVLRRPLGSVPDTQPVDDGELKNPYIAHDKRVEWEINNAADYTE